MAEFRQIQRQVQSQKQIQKLSQRQIQAVRILTLPASDLRREILKTVNENPALKIVNDPLAGKNSNISLESYRRAEGIAAAGTAGGGYGGDVNAALEAREGHSETLQQHLLSQLNMVNISADEYDLSKKLIYNLDKNGCYGSMLAPESLLDRSRPLQTKGMLRRCIERIQEMDPVGTCCKTPEESLYIQAKVNGNAPELALFLLNGRLEMLNPPTVERVLHKLNDYINDFHKKSFGGKLELDDLVVNSRTVDEAIKYILSLNPRPAGDYISDIGISEFDQPDIVLNVVKVEGHLSVDDFSTGKIATDDSFYFQVKYASGILPEIQLATDVSFDKESVEQAKAFLGNLEFRQNTIVLQGCAIVSAQKEFFMKGPGNIVPLTRRQVAQKLQIHESTVSRMSAKKSSKYIQTQWGLFPASYFFSSGVGSCAETENNKTDETDVKASLSAKPVISAEAVQFKIARLEEEAEKEGKTISDNKMAQLLNEQGIKIARRTVAKYRQRAGLKNSYGK